MNTKYRLIGLAGMIVLASMARSLAQGNDNPTGVAGDFNGSITTAGNYDPYTGNAKRIINDITVPGCVGDYPLKWTRTSISRTINAPPAHFGQGGPWIHSYRWTVSSVLIFTTPDGATIPFTEVMGLPNSEFGAGWYAPDSTTTGLPYVLEIVTPNYTSRYYSDYNLLLPDGGKVVFIHGVFKKLIDPHGLETTFSTVNGADRITEPGGRYLQLNYVTLSWGAFVLGSVQAYDGVTTTPTQTVTYNYTRIGTTTSSLLTQVNYDDGTTATYTYYPPGDFKANALQSCDDVRYSGPMKKIYYEYTNGTYSPGAACIWRERYSATGAIVSQLTYNSDTVRTETRADGKARTFTYLNGYGELGSLTDFKGKTTSFTYVNYKTSVTDARGNRTDLVPNDIGLYTTIQYPLTPNDTPTGTPRGQVNNVYGSNSGGVDCHLMSTTDEAGHTTTYTRDTNNRVTRIDYPDGGFETFTYNSFGEVLSHQLRTGGTETFTYDARGLKLEYRDPAHATGNPTALYAYDALDRVKDVTDALGSALGDPAHTTSYTYNQLGQILTTTKPIDPVDGQRHTVTNTYNADGTLASTTNELGYATTYTHDDYKRIRSVTTPQRFAGDITPRTAYTYYDATGIGDDYSHTEANPTFIALPGGEITNTTYDENRRKLSVTVGYGTSAAATTSYEYDDVGNVTGALLPKQQPGQPYAGQKTVTQYDERNRAYSVTDPLGRTTSTMFDAAGRKAKVTRPNTQVTTFDSYDSMNRLLQQTVKQTPSPDAVTKFTYDPATGLLATMQDPRLVATGSPQTYSYTYDNMGRKTQVTYPAAPPNPPTIETWHYDTLGRVDTFTNRAGTAQATVYDALSRVTSATWSDAVTPSVTFGYDVASRKTSIVNSNATIGYSYFNDNLLNTETTTYADNTPRTVTYSYNANGNRASIQYPNGFRVNSTYTPRNQLDSLINNAGGATIASHIYDLNGNLTARNVTENSTSSSYTYDGLDRSTNISHAFAGGNTRTFDYGYYPLTNNRKWTRRDSNKGDVFGYDLNDEVTATQLDIVNPDTSSPVAASGIQITYDANGNRNTMTTNSVTDTYVTNDLNQYNARTSSPTSPGLYDPKGNATTNLDGTINTYDAQNRVLSVQKGTVSETYKYDGINRQVSRTIGTGAATYNVYDGWNLIAEYASGATTPATSYVYGPTGLIKRISGATSSYYYQDASGSTSHLANSAGSLLEWYRYDLQGAPIFYDSTSQLLTASTAGNRFLFTGQQWYSNVGVYDLRNRFYSPDVGRFLQGDPIGFKGDATNLYRYCGNNPIMRSDPSGEDGLIVQNGNNVTIYAQLVFVGISAPAAQVFKSAVLNYVDNKTAGKYHVSVKLDAKAVEIGGKTVSVPQTRVMQQKELGTSEYKAFGDRSGRGEAFAGTIYWKLPREGGPGSKATLDAAHEFPHAMGSSHTSRFDRSDLMVGGPPSMQPLPRPAEGAHLSEKSVQQMINNKGVGVSLPIGGGQPAGWGPSGNMTLGEYNWSISESKGPMAYAPTNAAEATNYSSPTASVGQVFMTDFAFGSWDPDCPYPAGPVNSAMYGNHSW